MEINIKDLNETNADEVLQSMGMPESCEHGGKEFIAGFVASKLCNILPGLKASPEEVDMLNQNSWVKSLGKEHLTVPSLKWLNWVELLESEFRTYHRTGDKYKINGNPGVLKGFCEALSNKYQEIPVKALEKYIKTRLFIRIKNRNKLIVEERRKAAKLRADRWTPYQVRISTSTPCDDETDEESYSDDDDEFEREEFERE